MKLTLARADEPIARLDRVPYAEGRSRMSSEPTLEDLLTQILRTLSPTELQRWADHDPALGARVEGLSGQPRAAVQEAVKFDPPAEILGRMRVRYRFSSLAWRRSWRRRRAWRG